MTTTERIAISTMTTTERIAIVQAIEKEKLRAELEGIGRDITPYATEGALMGYLAACDRLKQIVAAL